MAAVTVQHVLLLIEATEWHSKAQLYVVLKELARKLVLAANTAGVQQPVVLTAAAYQVYVAWAGKQRLLQSSEGIKLARPQYIT